MARKSKSKQNGHQNGMHGVFLTAAELTYRGFIVSVTSRNAYGADLLVTDRECKRTWSVQVKTNQSTAANRWVLSAHCKELTSKSHAYVFVGLKSNDRPKFLAVPSRVVAKNIHTKPAEGGDWYEFWRDTKWKHKDEGWEETFGVSEPVPGLQDELDPMQVQAATLDGTTNS